jgi:hypothetical protein
MLFYVVEYRDLLMCFVRQSGDDSSIRTLSTQISKVRNLQHIRTLSTQVSNLQNKVDSCIRTLSTKISKVRNLQHKVDSSSRTPQHPD